MKTIVISASLKTQPIGVVIEKLRELREKTGPAILIRGSLPREVLIERKLTPELDDVLRELYPDQINMWKKDEPFREAMAQKAKDTDAEYWVLGDPDSHRVEEEITLFHKKNIKVNYLP